MRKKGDIIFDAYCILLIISSALLCASVLSEISLLPYFEHLLSFLSQNWQGIIAITAIVFTVIQVIFMRQHNKLSLRPVLDFSAEAIRKKDEIFITHTAQNKGMGPAIIESFEIYELDSFIEKNSFQKSMEILRIKMGHIGKNSTMQFGRLKEGTTLSPQEKRTIISIKYPFRFFESNHRKISDISESFSFKVKYKSVYGDGFIYADGKLPKEEYYPITP